MLVKLGKHEIDLSKAAPLTLGDWRFLQQEGLIDKKDGAENLSLEGADNVIKMLFHFSQKVNKKVTMEDIEGIPISDLPNVAEELTKIFGTEKDISRPT